MSYNSTVLIVQGKNSQFDALKKAIGKAKLSHHIVSASDDALEYLALHQPSFIFLDLLIDDRDAIDLLSEIENREMRGTSTAVIFSDRNEHYVQITSLNAGADDFLVKPVNKRVFASRLNTWIRRQEMVLGLSDLKEPDRDFALDKERYALIVKEVEVSLQRKEFEIISLLISRPRKVFSRKEIRESVWGTVGKGKNRTIDVHIRNLRSKIGSNYIKTYKGVGYSFDK